MPDHAYNKDISKWGHLARAVVARSHLVTLFETEGVKKEELQEISVTEATAEAADRAQRSAIRDVEDAASKSKPVQDSLNSIFANMKQRMPLVIKDAIKANDTKTLKHLKSIQFGEKAIPKVPKASQPEEAPGATSSATTSQDAQASTTKAEKPVEDRDSKAQKALAEAATRLALYLEDQPKIYEAFVARKMSSTFKEELTKLGQELIRLREARMLALFQQKQATVIEHKAVAAHIAARKPIHPILIKLTDNSPDLDALTVEHLGILSAAARKKSKQKPRKPSEKENTKTETKKR